jgi:TRAP-type C4-dicarboxylate transport system permease small subunit
MEKKSMVDTIATRISQVIALVGLVGLLILACLTVMEGLLRWLLNLPILGIGDVSSLIVGLAIASCMPLVFAEERSISIKMLGTALGPRADSLLDGFGSFVGMIIFMLITWQMWSYTNNVEINRETTWVVNWSIAPWYRAATVPMALCVPVQALKTYSHIKAFFSLPLRSKSPGKAGVA